MRSNRQGRTWRPWRTATAMLLERVESMDGEASALVESLRAGAGRLAADLAAVETNMGELYDAASGARSDARRAAIRRPGPPAAGSSAARLRNRSRPRTGRTTSVAAPAPPARTCARARPAATAVRHSPELLTDQCRGGTCHRRAGAGTGDLDSARLIALNMALNGDSRADDRPLPGRALPAGRPPEADRRGVRGDRGLSRHGGRVASGTSNICSPS